MPKSVRVLVALALMSCSPRDEPVPVEDVVPIATPAAPGRDSGPRPDSLMAGDTARVP